MSSLLSPSYLLQNLQNVGGTALKTQKQMNTCNTRPVKKKVGLTDDNITVTIAVNSVRPSDGTYLMRFIKVFNHPTGFVEISPLSALFSMAGKLLNISLNDISLMLKRIGL
jgi:hypothetical protein